MTALTRLLSDVTFELVGPLDVEHSAAGAPAEYSHRLPLNTRANRYGAGPFCRFGLHTSQGLEGVYALFVEQTLCYIGECTDLARRFSPAGYGYISARNCYDDGQATNCKINTNVLTAAKSGQAVTVWFHRTSDRKSLESRLISELKPAWNAARRRTADGSRRTAGPDAPMAARVVFKQALRDMLSSAQTAGAKSLRVQAGNLHRAVGGYPGPRHRMPICCAVMRAEMLPQDSIVSEPPSGAGASLVIEYALPRSMETVE